MKIRDSTKGEFVVHFLFSCQNSIRISLLEAELRKNSNANERRRHSDIGTQGRRGSNLLDGADGGGVDQSVVDNLNDVSTECCFTMYNSNGFAM